MKSVLVGCEYSGTVRDAFLARGFDAWSNDIKAADNNPARHLQMDVQAAIRLRRWDLIILHIECTTIAVCGNRHYGRTTPRYGERLSHLGWAIETIDLARAHSDHVAVENPASIIFPILRRAYRADVQYVQPWQHGHPEQKKTGFALWNLPRLVETNNVYDHMMTLPKQERERIFRMPPSADRGHERSRFYTGIADAMAERWGAVL